MAPNQNVSLSPREMEVLVLAWQCMETVPKIDIDKLASLTGYTVNSASVTFNRIKAKIKALGDSATGTSSSSSTPKKSRKAATPTSTPRKRKKAAATAKHAADAASSGTLSKKAKIKAEDENEDDDEFLFGDTIAVKKEEDLGEDVDGFNKQDDFISLH